MKRLLVFSFIVILLVGCGSSTDDQNSSSKTTKKMISGQFIDAPVAGLRYECSSGIHGVTNISGTYTCQDGDNILFKIGDIILGKTSIKQTTTPFDLDNNSLDYNKAYNISQLLHSLDVDTNSDNGISIDSKTVFYSDSINIEDSQEQFEEELSSSLKLIDRTLFNRDESKLRMLSYLNKHKSDLALQFPGQFDIKKELTILESTMCKIGEKIINNKCVNKDIFEYGTIISNNSGRVWLDRNLGAKKVCESSIDTDCFGDYYQWGRSSDGHEKIDSNISTSLADTIVVNHTNFILKEDESRWTTVDKYGVERAQAWNPCPSGFKIPTIDDFENEKFTDYENLFLNLKIPLSGSRSANTGTLIYAQSNSLLWTLSLNGLISKAFEISPNELTNKEKSRTNGFTIRCIQDNLVGSLNKPFAYAGKDQLVREGETILFDGSLSNDSDGEIISYKWEESSVLLSNNKSFIKSDLSIGKHVITLTITDDTNLSSYDIVLVDVKDPFLFDTIVSPITKKVWMDRNLGAKRVCLTETDSNCFGDYYQWGRDFDGHEKNTSISSNEQVLFLDKYSDKFVKGFADWIKDDKWGTQRANTWNPCPADFRVPTLEEVQSENILNSTDAFKNLKLPKAGLRYHEDGSFNYIKQYGYYWTSDVIPQSILSSSFYFSNSISNNSNSKRAIGRSIRCIKD